MLGYDERKRCVLSFAWTRLEATKARWHQSVADWPVFYHKTICLRINFSQFRIFISAFVCCVFKCFKYKLNSCTVRMTNSSDSEENSWVLFLCPTSIGLESTVVVLAFSVVAENVDGNSKCTESMHGEQIHGTDATPRFSIKCKWMRS